MIIWQGITFQPKEAIGRVVFFQMDGGSHSIMNSGIGFGFLCCSTSSIHAVTRRWSDDDLLICRDTVSKS